MEISEERLKAKGWTAEEISHALSVLRTAEHEKEQWIQRVDVFVYWLVLIIAVLGNVAFSVALVPAIVALPAFNLFVVIAVTAAFFGLVCGYVVHKIDVIDNRHHVLYVVLVSLIGLLSFALVLQQANATVEALGFGYTHGFWLGIIYVVAFLSPYVFVGRYT
jgi:predicted tellurium resistance membrane protein TerC